MSSWCTTAVVAAGLQFFVRADGGVLYRGVKCICNRRSAIVDLALVFAVGDGATWPNANDDCTVSAP